MKGILNKTNRGWVVKQVVKEGPHAKLINQYPLIDNGHIDGLKLYDSNEGLEVEFEITEAIIPVEDGTTMHKCAKILTKCYCGHTSYCDCGPLPEENKPYVSDDFQIGPDGAYEHTEEYNTSPREKASELIVDYQIKVKSLDYNEAKQCALVMVDEIKIILYDQDLMIRYDYWFEVKKEIEKL